MPIPLTSPQFLAIANAAAALFPSERDCFVAQLAAELHGLPIGDGTVGRVIREVQAPARWSREAPRFERASKRAY